MASTVTGQQIVNAALTILGILMPGGTASGSDSTDLLAELNAMWDAWQIDAGLIFSILKVTGALSANVASYTIGTGATINVDRPSKIFSAFIVATVGSASNRNELKIVSAAEYYRHNDLAASASTPDELFPDFNVAKATNFGTVYLWPVPTVPTATSLELEVGVPFFTWDLATTVYIPYGYLDALQYALAWRAIPRFGAAVMPNIAEYVSNIGSKAEARIRAMNAQNLQTPVLGPNGQPAAQ